MKSILKILSVLLTVLLISGCSAKPEPCQVAATTLPVYEFTSRICQDTGITVTRLVNENVSCLHDYSLNVDQVRATESAQWIVINGAELESFMEDILAGKQIIDSSPGVQIRQCEESDHHHDHEDHAEHHHEVDSHIWLSPVNAAIMAQNICDGLTKAYPQHTDTFRANLDKLLSELEDLHNYGRSELSSLSCRELITFHDGFGYFAEAFDLQILEAVEEESGAEASAAELKHLIGILREHNLPAVFTETNGSDSAAAVIARETGAAVFQLDMAMSGDSYFEAMRKNIDTIKEAMG